MTQPLLTRRDALAAAAAFGAFPLLGMTADSRMLTRPIPSGDEQLPVIGLGTYSVFDVASTPDAIAERLRIVELLVAAGGSVVDTSPMYNRSEQVIGDVISAGAPRDDLFIATKVWTNGRDTGEQQMKRSAQLMRTDVIDLMQVHNLLDTAVHMETIRDRQERGEIRYSGVTHYRASAHDAVEKALREFRPQFVQINYSLGELPGWATEFAASWGQFFLKFIISHPAVTCVIPATSKAKHVRDNLEAGFGELPNAATRERMIRFVKEM